MTYPLHYKRNYYLCLEDIPEELTKLVYPKKGRVYTCYNSTKEAFPNLDITDDEIEYQFYETGEFDYYPARYFKAINEKDIQTKSTLTSSQISEINKRTVLQWRKYSACSGLGTSLISYVDHIIYVSCTCHDPEILPNKHELSEKFKNAPLNWCESVPELRNAVGFNLSVYVHESLSKEKALHGAYKGDINEKREIENIQIIQEIKKEHIPNVTISNKERKKKSIRELHQINASISELKQLLKVDILDKTLRKKINDLIASLQKY